MARNFKLPDLGEGIHEAEIIEVLVSVGDTVEEEDTLMVAETDKAAVEIPSPFSAKITAVNVEVGQIVNTGDVIVEFEDGELEAGQAAPETDQEQASESEEQEVADQKEEPARAAEKAQEQAPADRPSGRPVPASPATRRLARELDVDLHQVPASGPSGRVTSEDVRSYAEAPEEAQEEELEHEKAPERRPARPGDVSEVVPSGARPELPDFTRWGEVERIPLRSVRRATAKQMALSWSQVPHVVHQDEVDITELEEFRQKHKPAIEEAGGRLTPTVFAMKAAVVALKKHPRFNASLDPETEEIILKNYYHIGVAMDTDRGLLVPVIRDVDQKSIRQLSIELFELAQRTRNGEATLNELQGGTFSLTNIGILGGTAFAPIINFPEVAILGMARAKWQPVVQKNGKGEMVTENRLMLPLMLAFDHRVVDGADAARFMNVVKEALQAPDNMLMMM
jgi:pyruvate dehydrogenase E2 component (dihydrolipoamide acetyltransferase)